MRSAIITLLLVTSPALALSPNGSGRSNSDSNSRNSGSGSGDRNQSSTLGVALLGAVTIGVTIGSAANADPKKKKKRAEALKALAHQIEALRPTVVHDLVRARGPVLDGWLDDVGLTVAEQQRFRQQLVASGAQADLLRAVQAGPEAVERFADRFALVLRASVTPARWIALHEQS